MRKPTPQDYKKAYAKLKEFFHCIPFRLLKSEARIVCMNRLSMERKPTEEPQQHN